MKTDIEIAQEAKMKPITEIAAQLGLSDEHVIPYGPVSYTHLDVYKRQGGDRVSSLMDTLKIDEDTPIENRMITNTLESAQKKLEGRNFEIRKNVLKLSLIHISATCTVRCSSARCCRATP